jgi:hypothetical protein
MTYSSVVARDSVRLVLLHAALNDIDLLAADIGNAYLNATCRERIWTIAGTEFDELRGTVLIIEKALYGLKSSGAAWRAMLRDTILEMEFTDTTADHDVYRRIATKPNGEVYYEIICVYVDDLLVASHRAKEIMDNFAASYRLKEPPKTPDIYLGATISKRYQNDGSYYYQMDSKKYVGNIVDIAIKYATNHGMATPGKRACATPLHKEYSPELDDSPLLNVSQATTYQEFIGMLRWACELGRVDILLETALMSQYLAAPRHDHLIEVVRIFSYLKYNSSFPLRFVTEEKEIDGECFTEADWSDIYSDAAEVLPTNMPEPAGRGVRITVFCDANHAGNKVNRRSHTGFIIFVNSAPIIWYSKKQNTVESSSFGSEFNALRIAVEHVISLRYKLRMFGLPVIGPASIFCDNEAVQKSNSDPSQTLNKKHNSVCFHMTREAVAAGIIRLGWIKGTENPADIFTKILDRIKRAKFINMLTHNSVGSVNPNNT